MGQVRATLVSHIAACMKPGLFSHSPICCHCLQWLSSSVHADADAQDTSAGAEWSSSRHAKRARLSLTITAAATRRALVAPATAYRSAMFGDRFLILSYLSYLSYLSKNRLMA